MVERYDYDAYGKARVLNGAADADSSVSDWSDDADNTSDWANTVLFAGYRFDPATGFYLARYRWHHPTLGRWLSRDPLGYVDGMSLYEYCGGMPTGAVDPSGTDWSGVQGNIDFAIEMSQLRFQLEFARQYLPHFMGSRGYNLRNVPHAFYIPRDLATQNPFKSGNVSLAADYHRRVSTQVVADLGNGATDTGIGLTNTLVQSIPAVRLAETAGYSVPRIGPWDWSENLGVDSSEYNREASKQNLIGGALGVADGCLMAGSAAGGSGGTPGRRSPGLPAEAASLQI